MIDPTTMQPPEVDVEAQSPGIPMNGWTVDFGSTAMDHQMGSGYPVFNQPQPRRPRRKELFAESDDRKPAAGPSTHPFYNQAGPSESAYKMFGLKRKREESLEPIESWLSEQNSLDPMPMPIHVLDDEPGPSYCTNHASNLLKTIADFSTFISKLPR
jgi:hypothetical protein